MNAGDIVTLSFYEGAKRPNADTTQVISRTSDGRIALLHYDNPLSLSVQPDETWDCEIFLVFPKKVVVNPIRKK